MEEKERQKGGITATWNIGTLVIIGLILGLLGILAYQALLLRGLRQALTGRLAGLPNVLGGFPQLSPQARPVYGIPYVGASIDPNGQRIYGDGETII